MKITIKFNTGDDSFVNGTDTTKTIMHQVSKKITNGQDEGNIIDINGNSIGKFKVTT